MFQQAGLDTSVFIHQIVDNKLLSFPIDAISLRAMLELLYDILLVSRSHIMIT